MNLKSGFLKKMLLLLCCAALVLGCTACMNAAEEQPASTSGGVPEIPERLEKNGDGVPVLKVYNAETETIEEMDIETYIMGVVGGEMRNDWPVEALKAQAILARTFTMQFLSTKTSQYEGADISTDIHEAQAYNADAVNDRIREAVNATRGIVMAANGEFTQAWFHAHSGGKTELPTKALEYSTDPSYLKVVDSPESEQAPEEVKRWTAEFTLDEVREACEGVGVKLDGIESFEIGEKGESGRAVTFLVNGEEVSAPSFRLHIGASKLKSTLIDGITLNENGITFTGSGFGHGAGMSQWGAFGMAEEGRSAEEIIEHYYTGVELQEHW
ncbi:MAG: SpoIID/LytB domain-containing protein [Clostridia bacterium]|nr:SpoIID/LytB domain-containing protein [Clostridia bacterium]